MWGAPLRLGFGLLPTSDRRPVYLKRARNARESQDVTGTGVTNLCSWGAAGFYRVKQYGHKYSNGLAGIARGLNRYVTLA